MKCKKLVADSIRVELTHERLERLYIRSFAEGLQPVGVMFMGLLLQVRIGSFLFVAVSL